MRDAGRPSEDFAVGSGRPSCIIDERLRTETALKRRETEAPGNQRIFSLQENCIQERIRTVYKIAE
jgi:hypothetical protein